ncbi:serine hydrolase domain-containing protein [Flavobacterium hydatis]|jgi:CubicO group peptidase (beta-lactamase class C family)|uniref:Beta-lactamase-related domain-containing protein n=1 Tax=Flavobacterium hydatis TaxID=991 RepID=A0ABX4CGC7_FLAHY|nr:serine hydrolase domain-containing protein [Flavobacterium hydatis]OXA93299.1 hypothetical protein B0A62_13715 [Flavobacterium hydatis]
MLQLIKLFVSVTTILSFTICTAQKNSKPIVNIQLDKYISQVQEKSSIPGISVAVIKGGKIIHRNNYGKANIENNVSVSDKSIFRLYSLTKPIIATGVFQLIEQGRLSLEDSVSAYIHDLPSSWNSVQIKNLLTQSSGLPDIVAYEKQKESVAKEKVFADSIHFKKGEKFEYNQTNFWLLQKVIEKVTKQDIETFIKENQFNDKESGKSVFFSTDSRDIILNRVTPYFYYATGKMQLDLPNNGSYLNSCNGINITMDVFIAWDKKFSSNKLINDASKKKMWETFSYTQSNTKFTFGWEEQILNGHPSYGFSGGRITAYRNFPKDNLSIIFLANGLGGDFNVDAVVNQIAYLVDNDIIDYNVLAYESLLKIAQNNIADIKKTFTTLKKNPNYLNVNLEEYINAIGYILLNQDKKTSDAIIVFSLNAEEFPKSSNAFDSLAEAYEANKEFEKASLNYKKSKELKGKE